MAYQPAGNLTSTGTIAHLATVYYKRKGLDILKKRMRFMGVSEPDSLPMRQGLTVSDMLSRR